MEPVKVMQDGRVYATHSLDGDVTVIEKSDPVIVHDAPLTVVSGETVTITFELCDFDDEPRRDADGTLLLLLADTQLPLPLAAGRASLTVELHAALAIRQLPPFPHDARMPPFRIEVTP